MCEKMNFRHREERKKCTKKMKRFKINKETFKRFSKIGEKKGAFERRRNVFIQHLLNAKITENKKAIKFKR